MHYMLNLEASGIHGMPFYAYTPTV